MLYDYDLVVLGDSPAAATAASLAARQRARVAWVKPVESSERRQAKRATRGFHVLRELLLQRRTDISLEQVRNLADLSEPWVDPGSLAHLGVDCIVGESRFRYDSQGRSPLAMGNSRKALTVWATEPAVNQNQEAPPVLLERSLERSLLARRYLLAPAAVPLIPQPLIQGGLAEGANLPIDTIYSWIDWPQLPQSLAILGALPEAIALAQMLAQLGCHVVLMMPRGMPNAAETFPGEPAWTQALLTAAGVVLVPDLDFNQALQIQPGSPIQIQGQGQSFEVERVLVATGWESDWNSDDLSTVGLSDAVPLQVNDRLRSQNPQIYAVGAALGGSGLNPLALHEATVATQNALWSPWRRWKAQPQNQPKILWTLLPQVQMGLDQLRAEQRFPGQVCVLRAEAPNNWRMQLTEHPTGICELIVHASGRLLGATVIAAEATEWTGAIALALERKLSVQQLASLPYVHPSFGQLLLQAAEQFRWQRLADQPRREDLLERFFNWRRTGGI